MSKVISMGTQIMRDKMLTYTPEMYQEIEKYASQLEITCDYFMMEFLTETNTNPSPLN